MLKNKDKYKIKIFFQINKMKNTTKIIFGFLLIVIIICFFLIYKNKSKEGFINEIQTIDKTIFYWFF